MAIPPSGQLQQRNLARLMREMEAERASGILNIHPAGTTTQTSRIIFNQGRIATAQSADPRLNIVTGLAKLNILNTSQQQEVYDLAHNSQQALHDALAQKFDLNPQLLQTAMEIVSVSVLAHNLFMEGTFQFQPLGDEQLPLPIELSLATPVLLKLLFKRIDEASCKAHIERIAGAAYIWTQASNDLPEWIQADFYMSLFKEPTTLGQAVLETNSPDHVYRDLAYLIVHDVLTVTERIPSIPVPSINQPSVIDDPFKKRPTATNLEDYSEEHRTIIDDLYKRLVQVSEGSYFDILDIGRYATSEQVQRAYFGLARLYHQDRFESMALKPAEEEARAAVFDAIQNAYNTLSDDKSKQEYLLKLDMQESGMSTDIGELFQAERNFENVQMMLSSGHLRSAAQLMETILPVNPGNMEWKAYALYTAWWNERNKFEAAEVAKELSEILRIRPAIYQAAFFAGHLYLQAGDLKRADRYLRKCLEASPEHRAALNSLKVVARKKAEAEKGNGILGRLFKK